MRERLLPWTAVRRNRALHVVVARDPKTRRCAVVTAIPARAEPLAPPEERAKLVRRGRTPSFVDGQIAAIAAVRGLTVVTGNTRDFLPFGVKLADWL